MYIMVRHTDNVIVGSAINPIDLDEASAKGYIVYEIDDAEFTTDMMGSTLDHFDLVEDK